MKIKSQRTAHSAQRTAHIRRNALASALIAAGILSASPDVFAVDVANETEYNAALTNGDTTITITGSGFSLTAKTNEPTANVALHGQWNSGEPLPVINGNGLVESALDALDGAFALDSLRNLAIENFVDVGVASNVLNGMDNVRFQNNSNSKDHGGGFFADNFTGDLVDSQFINNRAAGYGGAFAANAFTGDILSNTFTNNSAGDSGGAISIDTMTGGIYNSRFINNSGNTGAVFIGMFNGGIHASTFIANRALPITQTNEEAAGGAVDVGFGDLLIENSTFLKNLAQSGGIGGVGGAIYLTHDENTTSNKKLDIQASGSGRTLFYGNLHTPNNVAETPNSVYLDGKPNDKTHVKVDAAAGRNVLMLDPMYGVAGLNTEVTKTGAGDWFLGGMSHIPGASTWGINQGTLTLTTVDYSGAIGVQNAGINLSHGTTAAFNLASGATLAGSGAITAKTINLQGDIHPGTWVNTGTLATNIANDISAADIAAIDVVQSSHYGTLTFNGDVTMTGAKYHANVGSTGKNLLNIAGKLTLDGSANELTIRLRSDAAVSNEAVISATGGITGSFDAANVFVTAPAFLDTSSVTASATQVGNNIVVNTSNASLNWNASGANTLALDAATPVFSINQNLTGTGTLTTAGAGTTLFLNGVNDYTGDTTVAADTTLRVGETKDYSTASVASKVDVVTGATIGGHGTLLGGLVLASGATVAPGASIGDLTVIGDIGTPGVIYEFDVNPDGTADHLIVNGEVKLAGSTLRVVHGGGSGTFGQSTSYTDIIQASGGVTGTFADIVNTLPLMDAKVDYLANSVDLTMTRNNTAFAAMGASGNQVRVGQALDALGNHVVANTVAQLDAAGIRRAMDNLSGELYASTRSALLGNRHLQNAIIQRTQSAAQQPLWVSTWGVNGHLSGNANVAKVDSRGLGLALGGDWRVSDALSAGVVLGYEDGRFKANARNARSDVDAYSAGGYVSARMGSMQVRGGVTYSHLDVDSQRTINVPGLQGQAKADYKGSKTQVFAEVSQAFAVNRLSVAPYVGISQSWLHTQSVRETGHSAALDVAAQTDHVTQSTLGLRLAYQLPTTAPVALTADLAWARAFGDTDSHTSNRFAGQGERFTAEGVEVGKNTALVGAGVQANLGPNAALSLGYQGQFGSRTRNHSAGVQIRVKF